MSSAHPQPPPSPPAPRRHHALALVPTAGMLIGAPLVNRVPGLVLGLPPLLLWVLACVLLTSAVMATIGALDRRAASRRPDTPGGSGA